MPSAPRPTSQAVRWWGCRCPTRRLAVHEHGAHPAAPALAAGPPTALVAGSITAQGPRGRYSKRRGGQLSERATAMSGIWSLSGGKAGRVGMWRGGSRLNISVSAPFVWRCLSGSTVTPFPHPAHRTGHADLPHPALGRDFTHSPTARHAQARLGVRARSARKDARVDRSRPCVA